MFFKKKQPIEPQYITKDNKLVGVKMGEKEYRIAAYELMMANSPGQKSIYLFDKFGQKVAWDIKSFEELDNMLRSNFQG
jgi:hypothetical protein